MKKTIATLILLISCLTIFAQEEGGEGDIFINNNPDYNKTSSTVEGITIISRQDDVSDHFEVISTDESADVLNSQEIIVDHLFTHLPFDKIKVIAKAEKKPYFIDFTADWCAPCKMMDNTTFRDYNVVNYAKKHFFAVQLDMTDFDAIELQAMYNITSLPTILFFDSEGNLIGRSTGLQTGTLFLEKLKEINTTN